MDSVDMAWLLALLAASAANALKFVNVTEDTGLSKLSGNLSLAAFADFNSDKSTDLLLLNRTGGLESSTLATVHWDNGKFGDVHTLLQLVSTPVGVAAVDFDGDGWLDILTVEESSSSFTGQVHWLNEHETKGNATFHDWLSLPLVIDANGDHLPDLMVVTSLDGPVVWLSQPSKSFTLGQLPVDSTDRFSSGSSFHTAIVDINSDCLHDVAMLLIPSDALNTVQLVVWLKDSKTGNFTLPFTKTLLKFSSASSVVGPPMFSDLNGDGFPDLILYSCVDENGACEQSLVHVFWQQSSDNRSVVNCQDPGRWDLQWVKVCKFSISGFALIPGIVKQHRPVLGDVDLDGYPDLLIIAKNVSSPNSLPQAMLALNQPFQDDCTQNQTRLRELEPVVDPSFMNEIRGVVGATFFDLKEDGVLDILLVVEPHSEEGGVGDSQLFPLCQSPGKDHMFLKTVVLSGSCLTDCLSGQKPFGSSLPGAVISYKTQDRNGHTVTGTSITATGASFLNSPSLPFVLLGLGDTPNFIETLTIGVAHNTTNENHWYHQWKLLVPNSALILIPQPFDHPSQWILQLYLTPSHLVYGVSGVLLAICCGVLVVVILLQAREKYQDSKERKQQKQKFHFNAM